MKCPALFSSKDKSKIKCPLLQFLFGALRVKSVITLFQEGFTLEEESESDKETVASLNPDLQSGPLDRDVYDISTEIDDNEEGTERIDSPHLKLHMSVSEHDDSIDGDKQEQVSSAKHSLTGLQH